MATSEFYVGQSVLVGPIGTPQIRGKVTDLVEIHPLTFPGTEWWPQITFKNGILAVFSPGMVYPESVTEAVQIIIEADVSRETAERIQEFLNTPEADKEPAAGFAFHDGHHFNVKIDADSVKFRP
jgi:hypothetical protein